VLNSLFFLVLAIVFGALSFGARLTSFAPVQPDFLPLIGIVLTLLMLLLVVGQLFSVTRAITVVIDNHERFVRVVRGYRKGSQKSGRTLIQSPYEGIEYVLISHVITRREEDDGPEAGLPTHERIWAEIWLHLFSPRRGFINVCYSSQVEGRAMIDHTFNRRHTLDLNHINTPAHHAAQYMGNMIDVPVYVEER
jgi:hypothetical protein